MHIKESAKQKIIEFKKLFILKGFNCNNIEEKQYNFEITATRNNTKNKIQVYFGKKGIRNVIQGSTSSREYQELNSIISGNPSFTFQESNENIYTEYIGTDETGKGDYFGPLVIAGMYVDENICKFLQELGVRDSKELSDPQIDKIANIIKNTYPSNYSIISLKPEKYNQLYEKIQNVNKLLDWGHSKVIESIYEKYKPDTIIVDQFSKTPLKVSLTKDFSNVNFVYMPKAEKHIGVAAASILARNEMSQWFYNQNDSGLRVLRGASVEVENAARNIYYEKGRTALEKLVKLHFKTTKKIFED